LSYFLSLEGSLICKTKGEIQVIAGNPCLNTKDSASQYNGSLVLYFCHVGMGERVEVGMCFLDGYYGYHI
jgi:hypothetical protein